HLTHPATGDYPLDWQVLRTPDEQQLLMVMTAPPESDSLDVLRRLARATPTDS
ncbi:transcriptional regulator, partial [Streptomyces shenzhenensis]